MLRWPRSSLCTETSLQLALNLCCPLALCPCSPNFYSIDVCVFKQTWALFSMNWSLVWIQWKPPCWFAFIGLCRLVFTAEMLAQSLGLDFFFFFTECYFAVSSHVILSSELEMYHQTVNIFQVAESISFLIPSPQLFLLCAGSNSFHSGCSRPRGSGELMVTIILFCWVL